MSTARPDSRSERPAAPRRRPGRLAAPALALGLIAAPEAGAQGPAFLGPMPRPGAAVDYARPGSASVPVMPTPPPCCAEAAGLGPVRLRFHQRRRAHQATCLGYPEEFNEWPLGRAVYANMNAQVENAVAARAAFHDYDFVAGTDRLNLRGWDKLARIAGELPTNFYSVVVERTPGDPGLDQGRRLAVLAGLNTALPVPAERVLVGPAPTQGLRGVEALITNQRQLAQTASGGATAIGTGGGGGGGFDASGLSGAAGGGGAATGR